MKREELRLKEHAQHGNRAEEEKRHCQRQPQRPFDITLCELSAHARRNHGECRRLCRAGEESRRAPKRWHHTVIKQRRKI